MKLTSTFAAFVLSLLPVCGALSLDTADESSVLQNTDTASKDAGKNQPEAAGGKAEDAFAAGDFEKGVALALPRAVVGDPDAIYLMGFANETGKGVPQSMVKAIEYYRQGAAKGHADSIYRLAMNLAGSEAAGDVREAQEMLEKQAEKDTAVAGRILGELFLRGRFTAKPDVESAVSWWKKAVEAGDIPSMNFLASFYDGQMGFPEKKDPALTLEYYGAAAAKGDTSAMNNLGSRLLTGDEKLRDERKGKEWIAKAIAAKDASGYFVLGVYQENVKKDFKAAFAEYSKGAKEGQLESMIRAAAMYTKGEGTEKNEAKATELLEKAAEAGSAQAHLELAVMILNNEKPDLNKGYTHLLTAANGGLAFAQNELGIFYLSGKLGIADLSAAVSWFDRAARASFAPAQSNLGTLYESGSGVPQNFQSALQLYNLAAQQGHPGATLALARLNAAGAGTKQSFELAWALATIAGERGEKNAAAFLTEVEKQMTKEQLAAAKKELERMKSGKAAE